MTTAYAYDNANELKNEQTTEPGNGSYTNSYTYDGAQNRTSLNGTSIGHNADNQLSASGAYAYDGNGNPTTYTSPGNPVSGVANTNTFDPENRMTAYGVSDSSALLKATYDSDGLRTSKTNSSGTTYYVYDQQDRPVVELNASGGVSFVNTFGDNGLLSRRDMAGGVTTYYAFDPQGSAVDVMQNGTGSVGCVIKTPRRARSFSLSLTIDEPHDRIRREQRTAKQTDTRSLLGTALYPPRSYPCCTHRLDRANREFALLRIRGMVCSYRGSRSYKWHPLRLVLYD